MKGDFAVYDSDLLRGNTNLMLLFLIEEQGASYGYRIIKEIEARSRGYFHFREGTVYPALRKLENEGLLQGEWKKLPGGLERRYYRITPAGQQYLQKKLAMWRDFSSAMQLVFKPAET
jgi:PadR family transcriptional regulator PadR